jgi:predicted RNA binding protein YcfA (HicA-like mRNA interferase family)
MDLAKALTRFGYTIKRQTGSHIRLTCTMSKGEHHITIPAHKPLKIGTLHAILCELAAFLEIDQETILKQL